MSLRSLHRLPALHPHSHRAKRCVQLTASSDSTITRRLMCSTACRHISTTPRRALFGFGKSKKVELTPVPSPADDSTLDHAASNNAAAFGQPAASTASSIPANSALHRLSLSGPLAPSFMPHEYSEQFQHYLASGGKHIELQYNANQSQYLDVSRTAYQVRASEMADVHNVATVAYHHLDTTSVDTIFQSLYTYIRHTLQMQSVGTLFISHLPTVPITDPAFHALLIALETVCNSIDPQQRLWHHYGLQTERMHLPDVNDPLYIDLALLLSTSYAQHFDLPPLRHLIAIRPTFNLLQTEYLRGPALDIARANSIQIHTINPFSADIDVQTADDAQLGPIDSDISMRTYSTDEQRETEGMGWGRWLQSAFDTVIALEHAYTYEIDQSGRDMHEFPPLEDVVWGTVILRAQDTLYNITRWEANMNNVILPRIEQTIAKLQSEKFLSDWLKRYRFAVKTLLHRFSRVVQHSTQLQNVEVCQVLDKLCPPLQSLPTIEAKVVAVLQSVPNAPRFICTDNSTVLQSLYAKPVELDPRDALRVLSEVKPQILPCLLRTHTLEAVEKSFAETEQQQQP